MPTNEVSQEYKTILLIGGELHDIQVVIEKNETIFQAVFAKPDEWETKYYRESSNDSNEFVLQE